MPDYALATPTRRLFIDMLTADIAMEDALLDLIDNSIDSLIENQSISLNRSLLDPDARLTEPAQVTILLSPAGIEITDDCGGMDPDDARDFYFRLGYTTKRTSSLGVYGIGMKRALFKLGDAFCVESWHSNGAFKVWLTSVDEWAKDPSQEWHIPYERLSPDNHGAGTRITVTSVRPEIIERLNDGTLLRTLTQYVASTYSLFLDRFVHIRINDVPIVAKPIPIAASDALPIALHHAEPLPDVQCSLVAGLAQRQNDRWSAESAGWYVLCNGRVVVSADKTLRTGWGEAGYLPAFKDNFRGFIGIAYFWSTEPAKLPWTTTKRGLNRDAESFQNVRPEMASTAKPVIAFLRTLYGNDVEETTASRTLLKDLHAIALTPDTLRGERVFVAKQSHIKPGEAIVNVQFQATRDEIESARSALNDPSMAAGKLGRYAFEYFLTSESP